MPTTARTSAQWLGAVYRTDWVKNIDGPALTIIGESRSSIRPSSPPDDRPLVDRTTSMRGTACRMPLMLRQQFAGPWHFPDGRHVGQRRTVRPAQDRRSGIGRSHPADGEPGQHDAAGGLHRCRRDADVARRDRRLCPVVDDAARLHVQSLLRAGQLHLDRHQLASLQQQLHARRPAAGAQLHAHGPGRQSHHRRGVRLGQLHSPADRRGRAARSLGGSRQLRTASS